MYVRNQGEKKRTYLQKPSRNTNYTYFTIAYLCEIDSILSHSYINSYLFHSKTKDWPKKKLNQPKSLLNAIKLRFFGIGDTGSVLWPNKRSAKNDIRDENSLQFFYSKKPLCFCVIFSPQQMRCYRFEITKKKKKKRISYSYYEFF